MKSRFLIILYITSLTIINAQEDKVDMLMFEPVFNSYSPKKVSTVILENGTVVKGFRDDVDRKKGQIYYVKLKDSVTGEKYEHYAEDIKEMYLFPGGFERFTKKTSHIFNAREWGSRDLQNDLIDKGFIYFKKQTVSLKNKKDERELLMQLINPRFCSVIEVYGDPMAKKTTRLGIGGLNVAGGLEKSYYFKKDGNIFWLEKKNLKKYYDKLFGDNAEFMKKYPKNDLKWKELGEYVFIYTKLSID
ncbi:hypothetical protein RM697_13295 [Ichthyenterobacterium sp. W332]|uniref:Uncharacterized protein n=1 Tax=Microcosmobacter mediterraneus TaxID=3075607 RepID=A0ABU2YN95_9FLAO|nr:hypothetical protein [Ichthyenterobacterium sp. W332]MDT0559629.1 hypothetical protein [Ichthyenterobacterium sp. W332]